ncbi:MAG: TadE/TadG family type IV pilus assembly protein [Pseudomonadota bacterium]
MERGAAAVEFAIVLFPLTFIMIGIVNFGYAFFAYNTINDGLVNSNRAFTHGELSRAEARRMASSVVERFSGSYSRVLISEISNNKSEITLVTSTDRFTLIDFPFASLSHYRSIIVLRHQTPIYNLDPYKRSGY